MTAVDGAGAASPWRERLIGRLRAAGCVFAEEEADLILAEARAREEPSGGDGNGVTSRVEAMAAAREAGAPLEQVLGWAGFAGLRIAVAPGVFVPRRRTELLAREAVALAREAMAREAIAREAVRSSGAAGAGAVPGGHGPQDGAGDGAGEGAGEGPVAIDLCCGTGALAAVLRSAVPGLRVLAADIDPAAVACARANLVAVGGAQGDVLAGDLFDALPAGVRGRVAVLAVNAPYVPTEEIAFLPPEAREHEPRVALDGGPDGVDVQRRVLAGARSWLAPGGHVLIETGRRQVPVTAACAEAAGMAVTVLTDDEIGGTVVRAALSGAS